MGPPGRGVRRRRKEPHPAIWLSSRAALAGEELVYGRARRGPALVTTAIGRRHQAAVYRFTSQPNPRIS
jgi:hypothetical protein